MTPCPEYELTLMIPVDQLEYDELTTQVALSASLLCASSAEGPEVELLLRPWEAVMYNISYS